MNLMGRGSSGFKQAHQVPAQFQQRDVLLVQFGIAHAQTR